MKSTFSRRDRFFYWVENLFSRGTVVMVIALGALSLAIVLVSALVLSILPLFNLDQHSLNFFEAFWQSLMRTLDAGTMGGDEGWAFRLVMLLFPTLGGIFVISALIGVLTTGLDKQLEELRKGRSRVLESNHTVILGWSEQIFTILSELKIANQNQKKPCIVILGPKDKIEMEDEIRARLGQNGNTRIVCRTGSSIEITDLQLVGLERARAVIALSPGEDDPDSEVIKTVLAVRHLTTPGTLVAEIRDVKNMAAARVVGKEQVEWVLVGDLIARIVAQTSRQSGLSVVYTELMDFEGDEMYFWKEPALVGKTFGEALAWFEKNAVMGLKPAGGAPRLNPGADTPIGADDQLIVLAADDDQIFANANGPGTAREELIVTGQAREQKPERNMILGWNWRGRAIVRELNNYAAWGSELVVVAETPAAAEALEACQPECKRMKLTFRQGDITDRRTLEALDLERVDHLILLCYSDDLKPQQADARTLVALLHLRDLADTCGYTYSIVTEMLDIRNRELADITRADDFIVSDKLVSLMMAQVSENRDLNAIFADIFDADGSEIYLKHASDYVKTGLPVNFYTVVEAARRRGQAAIGYRLERFAHDAQKAYGVTLNPAKSETVVFNPKDRIIVLAEE